MSDEEENIEGEMIAFHLADALYHLGFPWDKIGDEGLKITERFGSPEAQVESDEAVLTGMRSHFEGVKKDPPEIPVLTFDPMLGPSEHMVMDELIASLEDLAGHLPWVAEPIYDILNDYDEYLVSVKAPKRLKERSRRLRHAISDLESHASGRA